MLPFATTTASDQLMTTALSRPNNQLYVTQNFSVVEPSRWVTCSTPIKNEPFSPGRAVEAHELIRNGLLPQLDTMQLMQMQGNSKRTKLELCPEDEEKRRIRREKNKVAAAKCRVKNREHSRNIKQDYEILERQQIELREQLRDLQADVGRLEGLLSTHHCILSEQQKADIEERLEREGNPFEMEVGKEDKVMEGGAICVDDIQRGVSSSTKRQGSEADLIVSSSPTVEG